MASASSLDFDVASPPALRLLLRECMTPLDWARTRALRRRLLADLPHGSGQPVLVLPGYLTSDRSTAVLRDALTDLGYAVYGWDRGRNLGLSRPLVEALLARLRRLRERHARPVALVGWSLGGIIARELARQAPEEVRMVISLGSPFRGNVRANHLWRIHRWLRGRRPPKARAEPSAPHPLSLPLSVPTTCFYSRRDGFVAWQCCLSDPAPHTENIEVACTHLAYGFDPDVLRALADRLALPDGHWHCFGPA